jgi:REP element-mobilizing transposase RayT
MKYAMPRTARVKSRTGIYHIMVRGINRQDIFHDDEDRKRYLDTLKRITVENISEVLGYCIMSNHIHLIIKEGEAGISQLMKRLYKSKEYRTDHPELFANNMQGVFFLKINDKEPAELVNPSQGFDKLINGKIENRPYKIDEYPSEETKDANGHLFKNGMDEKDLIKLIKNSI